jgi:hypothetical protein
MSSSTFIRAGMVLAFCATTHLGWSQASHPNGPPSVQILAPQEGAILLVGKPIYICSAAQNFTDAVAQVEFFAGANVVGLVTNKPAIWGGSACICWSNAAVGAYMLKAVATDLAGNTATSAPVGISVVADLPPTVCITKPLDGALILGPTNIKLCASAFDPDGKVVSVQFFDGSNRLGVVTNTPTTWLTNWQGVFPVFQSSYSLTWSNVAVGPYTSTAVATDNAGVTATSAPVQITVVSDLPPLVSLLEPFDGARFYAPANVGLCAAAKDPDGTVASVQFFQGTKSLGVATTGTTVTNWGGVQTLYFLRASNLPPANYTFTAVATDNGGLSSTSAPVAVKVVALPPPVVKIVNPSDGAKYVAPASIYISTVESYFQKPVATIKFLSGTKVLSVSNSPSYYWKNVPVGAYTLTAIATDTGGQSVTSAPVPITVTTNRWPSSGAVSSR